MDVALQLHTNTKPTYLLLCPANPRDQAASNKEDAELNEKLIRRYGVPKSRTLTSSAFMSPIGQEHYELFEPLTGAFHDSIQQAHGLREKGKEKEEEASLWCTRHVLLLASNFVFLARN